MNKPYTPLRLRKAIDEMDNGIELLTMPANYDAAELLSHVKFLMRQTTKVAHVDSIKAHWYNYLLQQLAAKLRQELRGCDVVLSEACLFLCSMAAEDLAFIIAANQL